MKPPADWLVFFSVVGLLAAVLFLVASSGCDPRDTTAEQAAEKARIALYVKMYGDALDDCKAKGKDAGSYAVYEVCAVQADIRFGRKDGGQ